MPKKPPKGRSPEKPPAPKAALGVPKPVPPAPKAALGVPKPVPPAPKPAVPPAIPDEELDEEGEPLAEEFERFFLCPLCGARVSVLLDPSVESQTLIEDCEVCCQPLEIKYTVEEGKIAEFDVQPG